MFRKLAVALAVCAPLAASAASYEINAYCGQSVRSFFIPLIQQNLINPKPAGVSRSGVNQFNPRLLKNVTAFGLQVAQVVGYTNDPLLFTVGVVDPETAQDVYGVLVLEGIGNVQAHLTSLGESNARLMRIDAKRTLIMCKGE